MPNYVFQDEAGCRYDLYMSFDELLERQYKKESVRGDFIQHEVGGDLVELKRVYVPFGSQATGWPKRSMSMGVGVDQIEEAMKADREHGLKIDYDPKTGDAIHTSLKNRRDHMKILNMVDRDSFI